MLKSSSRIPSRDTTQRSAARIKESLRENSARNAGESGDSPSTPQITSWFDGIKTRGPFLPGLSEPDGPYYVPPPHRPADMTDAEFLAALMKKFRRRRMLL